MNNIELYESFRKIISYLVEKRQDTAARAVLQGALLVIDSPSSRAELAALVGGVTNAGVRSDAVGGKSYTKLDLGAASVSSVQKKTSVALGQQVQRRIIGGAVAANGSGAIIQKNGAINFQNSGIDLEKPYVNPDEIEYENGGEFREFAEGLEGEGETEDGIGIDQDGEKFEVVDGGDVELRKVVSSIRGRKKRTI
jgi:hypothetical protein